eukprot:768739-Hanusia_phi.AAC.13
MEVSLLLNLSGIPTTSPFASHLVGLEDACSNSEDWHGRDSHGPLVLADCWRPSQGERRRRRLKSPITASGPSITWGKSVDSKSLLLLLLLVHLHHRVDQDHIELHSLLRHQVHQVRAIRCARALEPLLPQRARHDLGVNRLVVNNEHRQMLLLLLALSLNVSTASFRHSSHGRFLQRLLTPSPPHRDAALEHGTIERHDHVRVPEEGERTLERLLARHRQRHVLVLLDRRASPRLPPHPVNLHASQHGDLILPNNLPHNREVPLSLCHALHVPLRTHAPLLRLPPPRPPLHQRPRAGIVVEAARRGEALLVPLELQLSDRRLLGLLGDKSRLRLDLRLDLVGEEDGCRLGGDLAPPRGDRADRRVAVCGGESSSRVVPGDALGRPTSWPPLAVAEGREEIVDIVVDCAELQGNLEDESRALYVAQDLNHSPPPPPVPPAPPPLHPPFHSTPSVPLSSKADFSHLAHG